MKKMSGLLFGLLLGAAVTQAQRHEPVNPQTDKMDFEGYTIRVWPAMGGYGYDIVKGKQVVLHQGRNPFTGSPRGLASKEDAFKVARWQIGHQKDIKAVPQPQWDRRHSALRQRLDKEAQRPSFDQRVPLGVAKALHIRLH